MSLQSSLLYTLFYGMTTSVQDLGLKSIQLNGIFLGITQSLGFLSVLPFTHKMKRKEWSLKFQAMILISALFLITLSLCGDSSVILFLQTIISTCLLASIMSASFPLIFLYISELFPTETRGLASALILFFGKMVGALAPFLSSYSQKMGLHILVGCCIPVVFSLPLTYICLEETLGVNSVKHSFMDYNARELGRDMADYYFDNEEARSEDSH